jgi:SsrA-binding protein
MNKNDGVIAVNRRAKFDYDILDRYEAGIVLTGSEIKSVRQRHVQLQGAYARFRDGELWLQDAHIAPYANAGYQQHNPTRDRKLLLHRKELLRIEQQLGEKGLTLIPLSMYLKDGKAKVELGLVRGRRKHDKRQAIRERETKRELERAVRTRG